LFYRNEIIEKTPKKVEPALVECLNYIDSGVKSPPIKKTETYESKLMNSVSPVVQSSNKIFNFGGNKNEQIKPKLTEEKQQQDFSNLLKNGKEILKIIEPNERTSFKNVDDEKCRSCNTVYSKGKFGGNFDSRIYFRLNLHKLLFK
jgi:hypothetical protein